jgi:hypothetical protein
MVLSHNVWTGGASALPVTVVGWITLTFLFLPPAVEADLLLGKPHYQQYYYVFVCISLVLGIYLTYNGFARRAHS